MHSKSKGKSGSKKPLISTQKPSFSKEEIEELVINLANKDYSTALIGTILRDQYGITSVKELTGKTISKILKEKNLMQEFPEELINLIKKAVNLLKHLEENKKDFSAKRGYGLTVSKIRRRAIYYKRKGILPKNWIYNPEKARLIVR